MEPRSARAPCLSISPPWRVCVLVRVCVYGLVVPGCIQKLDLVRTCRVGLCAATIGEKYPQSTPSQWPEQKGTSFVGSGPRGSRVSPWEAGGQEEEQNPREGRRGGQGEAQGPAEAPGLTAHPAWEGRSVLMGCNLLFTGLSHPFSPTWSPGSLNQICPPFFLFRPS